MDVPDLVDRLSEQQSAVERFKLGCFSPDDGKYFDVGQDLREYLSAEAEWRTFAYVQHALMKTRMEFGRAEQWHVDEVHDALDQIDPLNMALLEKDRDLKIFHDQLAVIEEISRHISPETAALLHPGTTSYDIVDTARAYLFKGAWTHKMRPRISEAISHMADLAERYLVADMESLQEGSAMDYLQTGRTHLQNTSPVPLGATLAGYAARLADRVVGCDRAYGGLRGKVSGIVGSGAGIEMVIGEGESMRFEEEALAKLGLKPDLTATQVVQKERLADVGNGLVTLMYVLVDFARDMRKLYSSAIGEVTSRENKERLGGSSTDAGKNNPINWENIAGKGALVEAGMRVLYEMIPTDFQRDLESSVQARYQPHAMMVEVYEAFTRLGKGLGQLSVNVDRVGQNLVAVRDLPTEAMTTILKGSGYIHPEHGPGHSFVKKVAREALASKRRLIDVAREDAHFEQQYQMLPKEHQEILDGRLERYTGHSLQRGFDNIANTRTVVRGN